MRTSDGGRVVLTMFHPTGARHFFQEPLHEFLGATVSLDQFIPAAALDRIVARVAEATSHRERVQKIEEFLPRATASCREGSAGGQSGR